MKLLLTVVLTLSAAYCYGQPCEVLNVETKSLHTCVSTIEQSGQRGRACWDTEYAVYTIEVDGDSTYLAVPSDASPRLKMGTQAQCHVRSNHALMDIDTPAAHSAEAYILDVGIAVYYANLAKTPLMKK